MYSQAGAGKSFKGSVGVETFQGRIRLRLPRQLFGGKQKYLTLGLSDTDVNRRMAEAKAKLIESDIALERFDYTLEKYGKPKAPTLTIVEAVKPKPKAELDLAQLWERYKEARAKKVSETTMKLNYARVTGHIQKLPTVALEDATLAVSAKQRAFEITYSKTIRGTLLTASGCNSTPAVSGR
ncbi:MAG: DUF3596 domain-containing protein [Leptolyngbyaceae cyanobacterium bins.349]|nr:DUF3596 domain-containing protein [Leptolyngbyaceae cyanobacterium bins.349]